MGIGQGERDAAHNGGQAHGVEAALEVRDEAAVELRPVVALAGGWVSQEGCQLRGELVPQLLGVKLAELVVPLRKSGVRRSLRLDEVHGLLTTSKSV